MGKNENGLSFRQGAIMDLGIVYSQPIECISLNLIVMSVSQI